MAHNTSYIKLHNLLNKSNVKFDKKKIKNISIDGISSLDNAKINYISLFSQLKYLDELTKTKASAIVVSPKLSKYIKKNIILIVVDDPEIEFSKILNFFFPDSYYSKITYKSLTHNQIKKKYRSLNFGINFYLEKDSIIGKDVLIGNNVTIKKKTYIGNNVIIGSNVVIENSIIEDDVHICDGSIIGKKGFGFKFVNGSCIRIPHIGRVIIKKGSEIGSNCVIDRGSLKDTVIGENTFIDNLVHIAHNVIIGDNCIFAAQTGVAGSTRIGNGVIIGGQAGISGHLRIGNNVKIGGKSGVVKSLKNGEKVMGYPAIDLREFIRRNKNNE